MLGKITGRLVICLTFTQIVVILAMYIGNVCKDAGKVTVLGARPREKPLRLKGLCARGGEVRLPSIEVKRLAGRARYRASK